MKSERYESGKVLKGCRLHFSTKETAKDGRRERLWRGRLKMVDRSLEMGETGEVGKGWEGTEGSA